MSQITREIREIAYGLLRDGKVRVVIGFKNGSLLLRSRPCFIREESDVKQLVWNGYCENNLSKYLPKRKESIAIVTKGCDARAIVELIKENQITREQLFIIGIDCNGIVDRRLVENVMGNESIVAVKEGDEILTVKGSNSEKILNRHEFLYEHCKVCTHPVPVIYDILLAEKKLQCLQAPLIDTFSDVENFSYLGNEERWKYISKEISKCIRCYACRNACPMCYCPECFTDASKPQWVGKSKDLSDTAIFHLMRAFHLAGRCTGCGSCEQACPMGVDIRKLNRKLQKDVIDLFHYEAGCSTEEITPLATFKINDPQSFMVEP